MNTLLMPESSINTKSPLKVGVACVKLVKEFGDGANRNRVLHELDIDFYSNQLTLLVGPSGCGKTTLISIIAGLLFPTSGDVELFGTPQSRLKGGKLVRFRAQNVGFVFQQYNLLPALTATENVCVPLLIQGVPRSKALIKAKEMLDRVGLATRAGAYPRELSGGQQQRVAIARALVHEPRLLVCDEPTAALDGNSGRTVMQLIREVSVQPGRVVIVVTHDSRVYSYGDRMIEMSDGRVTNTSNSPSSSMTDSQVISQFKSKETH
ncbi:Lipoprotein-releasing system ATP-binding protein LolD [Planctopirus ephydatiae]|uniref:Lipoprotein-releasing system ATP-binding protein LolD n=1 Tax=Planctopirus ephydatiae TaxID=2528019 RepID=A0A518GL53_9PLAN|nr:ABC transporter ATP-binding protein [Planctopirus ephydatiae]QDV29360.1 Lipoprotein-releasing system ATP-binding protein LolD [Planctopirus ephydatiae]